MGQLGGAQVHMFMCFSYLFFIFLGKGQIIRYPYQLHLTKDADLIAGHAPMAKAQAKAMVPVLEEFLHPTGVVYM